MKYLLMFLILCASVFGADATWNGSTDDSWNTADNWTPAAVPGPTSTVIMANAGTPCVVDVAAIDVVSITQTTTGTLTVPVNVCNTITVDTNITCVGGDFLILTGSGALAIEGNLVSSGLTNDDTIHIDTGAGNVVALTITGDVEAGAGGNSPAINNADAETSITVTGNVTGGAGIGSAGIVSTTAASITVTGTVTGGEHASGYGINNTSETTDITIGTLAFVNGKAVPLSGACGDNITISGVAVNGTAIGTSSSGTTGALYNGLYN